MDDPRDSMKMMVRPTKYGRSINWDWKDWIGFITLVVVVVGLVKGDSAIAFLKLIGGTLTSIFHH